ncbi:MAG: PspC domain-containing protein [Bifidobacteriaceae bacterium]|nr:PspC domain-containing protein [Bifidobacteriaceae bacterium]
MTTHPSAGRPSGSAFFDWIRRQGIVRTDDRWLGGVAAGLAHRIGWDPHLMRGLFVVAALFSGVGLVLYGVAWLLIPEAPSGRVDFEEAVHGRFSPGFWGGVVCASAGAVYALIWTSVTFPIGLLPIVVALGAVVLLVAYAFNRPAAGWPGPGAFNAPPGPPAAPYPTSTEETPMSSKPGPVPGGEPASPPEPEPETAQATPDSRPSVPEAAAAGVATAGDVISEAATSAVDAVTDAVEAVTDAVDLADAKDATEAVADAADVPEPATEPPTAVMTEEPETTTLPTEPATAVMPEPGPETEPATTALPTGAVPPTTPGPGAAPGGSAGPAQPGGQAAPFPQKLPGRPKSGSVGIAIVGLMLLVMASVMALSRYTNALEDFVVVTLCLGLALIMMGIGLIILGFMGRRAGLFVAASIVLALVALPMAAAAEAVSVANGSWAAGSFAYWPDSPEMTRDGFSAAAGRLTVDLTDTGIRSNDGQPVDVALGIGQASVVLPTDRPITLNAEIGLGEIDVESLTDTGWSLEWSERTRQTLRWPDRSPYGLNIALSAQYSPPPVETTDPADPADPAVLAEEYPTLTVNCRGSFGQLRITQER